MAALTANQLSFTQPGSKLSIWASEASHVNVVRACTFYVKSAHAGCLSPSSIINMLVTFTVGVSSLSVVNKLCQVKEKTLVVHFGFLGTLLTTETRSHVKRMCDIEPLSWLLRHVPTTGIIFFLVIESFFCFEKQGSIL